MYKFFYTSYVDVHLWDEMKMKIALVYVIQYVLW